MTQLIVQLDNDEKAEMLSEMLSALTFVDSVKLMKEQGQVKNDTEDFFSLAGLWKNRDISAESIRKEAWPERNK